MKNLPRSPVAAIIINGELDRRVPPEGGLGEERFPGAWDGTPLMPAAYQGTFWASADQCDVDTPEVDDENAFVLTRFACPNGLDVEAYLVKDNGHAWPGGEPGTAFGDIPTTAFDATDAIWEFFRRHSLSGRQ